MKMKEIKFPFLAVLILLSFSACLKDKQANNAVADVYVKSILADGLPVYAVSQYVQGTTAMASVTVHTPDGLTDQLVSFDNSGLTFYKEPLLAFGDYSSTKPASGTYSYGVSFKDGEEKVYTNVLSAGSLLPAAITSISKLTDGQNVRMSWEPIVGAEYLRLSVYRADTWLYTSQPFSPPTANSIDVPISIIPSFTQGTYTYEIDGIIYESATSGLLQAVSTASVTIDL